MDNLIGNPCVCRCHCGNGYLNTQIEQFKVTGDGSFSETLGWSEKWNYLPSDYRIEPRIITHSDEKCN